MFETFFEFFEYNVGVLAWQPWEALVKTSIRKLYTLSCGIAQNLISVLLCCLLYVAYMNL